MWLGKGHLPHKGSVRTMPFTQKGKETRIVRMTERRTKMELSVYLIPKFTMKQHSQGSVVLAKG